MKLSNQPEGPSRAPAGLGRLKTAAAAGVLALAGTVANKADAQTRYDLPLDSGQGGKLNKLENPNNVQFSYGGIDGNGYAIDFTASREGDSIVLSQISGLQQIEFETSDRRLLVSDGAGCQNEILVGVYDALGQRTDVTLNGAPVWQSGEQIVRDVFQTKTGVGLSIIGPFGSAGNAYADNINGVRFPFDPNSSDWCADYNQMLVAVGNPLNNNEFAGRILNSRLEDITYVDGTVTMVYRGPNPNSPNLVPGLRVAVGNQYFISPDNGNSFVADPQQVNMGNPVNNFFPSTGVDMTGAQVLNGVTLTFGSDGVNSVFDAHEKVVAADGTVTLVRRPVVIREGFLDPAQRDMDGDGIQDDLDPRPGMNTPGGDVNRAGDVACHLNIAANQIGNGMIACDQPNVMATPEGSRLFTDGEVSATLANGVLTIGNVSADAQNKSAVEFNHAYDVSSGLPAAPSPNITFEAPAAGKGYVVEVDLKSNIGLDGQPHNVQVMNDAADLLNQIPLVINQPTGDVAARYEFAAGTIPVFALGGTVLAMNAYQQDVAQDPDAALPDAALPDAAVLTPDAAVVMPDAEVDAAVDAEVDANIVVVPVPDAAVVDAQEIDAQVVDAQELDAAVLPVDAAVQPVDARVVDAAPLPVDAAPLPVDMAPIPVDAAPVLPVDAAVQTPDAAVLPIDAGTAMPDGVVVDAGLPIVDASAQTDVAPNCEITGEEVCDGHDNDCDGLTDEDQTGNPLRQIRQDPCTGQQKEGICRAGEMIPKMNDSCSADAAQVDAAIDTPPTHIDAGLTAKPDAQQATAENGGGAAGGCSTVPGQNGLNGLPFILAAGVLVSRRREDRRNDPTRTDGRRFTDMPKA